MQTRLFGKTGLLVSPLGVGAAEIGYEGLDQAAATRVLKSALEAGINVIDTAECYKNSEELIGNALADRRDDYYLFTKTGHAQGYENPDWSFEGTIASIERSLKRLKTDAVDLVLLHSCSREELERGEATRGLQEARRRGLTRFIGYSGDGENASYAIESGDFDVLETSLNIADQQGIDLLMPRAQERGMGVIVKRPLANVAWKSGDEPPAPEYHHEYWNRLKKLDYEFLRDDLESAAQRATRFTLSIPGVHTLIVGTTKPERFAQNVAVAKQGPLPDSEYEEIRRRWRTVADAEWVGQT